MSGPAPVPKRRTARATRRQAAVLDAAAHLFGEKGFDATTMTEVAARANCAIGSLYLDYPTKEHLASAVNTQMADVIVAELDMVREAGDWDGIYELAGRLFDLFHRFRHELPALIALVDREPPHAGLLRARVVASIYEVLKAARPDLDDATLETAALVFLTLSKATRPLLREPDTLIRRRALSQIRHVTQLHLKTELDGTPQKA